MVPRAVSLLPSATEILAALGGTKLLVGRSHECVHPPGLEGLPVLTAPRTDPDSTSARIDEQVRESLAQNQSLYRLDTDRLRALRPDVILTQDLCRVCSIDLETVRAVAAELDPVPEVVSLDATTVEGVLDDILTVGAACGLEADELIVSLRERMYAAQHAVNPYTDGPVVAFLEWTDPMFCAGHWTVQLIERAGGRHPWNPTVAEPGHGAAEGFMQSQRRAEPSRAISPEELLEHGPEVLIVCPCGWDLTRTRADFEALRAQPWFNDVPAARTGRIALVDGMAMFNQPGPRLVDAYEWLVGFVNDRPELTPSGFPAEPG